MPKTTNDRLGGGRWFNCICIIVQQVYAWHDEPLTPLAFFTRIISNQLMSTLLYRATIIGTCLYYYQHTNLFLPLFRFLPRMPVLVVQSDRHIPGLRLHVHYLPHIRMVRSQSKRNLDQLPCSPYEYNGCRSLVRTFTVHPASQLFSDGSQLPADCGVPSGSGPSPEGPGRGSPAPAHRPMAEGGPTHACF